MGVTAVGGAHAGHNARVVDFARSTVVELIGRPHLDVWHKDRFIFPNIDLYIKLMPSAYNFVIKSAAPGNAAQDNFKMVIHSVILIIHTKQLISTVNTADMQLLQVQNMRLHYSRVQIKHLSILTNYTSINFDNVFTGALPDLVIVCLVNDDDLAGGYQ